MDDPFWDKVELGEWRLIGPRLAGAIVFPSLRMRLARARIREFFVELFGLELSTGMLDETIREAGRAVAPLEEAMVLDIEEAALLHAHETPWIDRVHRCQGRSSGKGDAGSAVYLDGSH
ncbi:MAG: transposase [Massilia sp.]|nr:transposase [Massilia sp.]